MSEKVSLRSLLNLLIHSIFNHNPERLDGQPSAALPSMLQRPFTDNRDAWQLYWKENGQQWRTEPEIDQKRQMYLAQRRTIVPDINKGIYPFKNIKLSRADIEWLLATHESEGRYGPVVWSDPSQRDREGLDLRGADLKFVSLRRLPLARLKGGLTSTEWTEATEEQRRNARIDLTGADLYGSHLEGAHLRFSYADSVDLRFALLERTHLRGACLRGANLRDAYLNDTRLENIVLCDEKQVGPYLADIHWGYTNLAVVGWTDVKILGDEYEARQKQDKNGKIKDKGKRLTQFQTAVRANRQLAVILQNQGLNEVSNYFSYRAHVLQRKVLWKQRQVSKWLFSMMLSLLGGYGYRMRRIIVAYLLVVSACAIGYFVLGLYYPPHLSLLQAFLESVTAFHGRVFSELFAPNSPQVWVTAFEAIMGLVIEGVFIAMLAQRFFGK